MTEYIKTTFNLIYIWVTNRKKNSKEEIKYYTRKNLYNNKVTWDYYHYLNRKEFIEEKY